MLGNQSELPQKPTHLPASSKTQDQLEHDLIADQAIISAARARQMTAVGELDRRQAALADGYRSLHEWVASRLDEALETAAVLVTTARTISAGSLGLLESGLVTLPRAAQIARLESLGIQDAAEVSWAHDIAGLRRRVAAQHHMTRGDQSAVVDGRYFAIQPTLDELSWRMWGQLPGVEGRIVEKALSQRLDEFPRELASVAQRRADALVSVCQDSLTGSHGPSSPMPVSVFVDAASSASTNGESGVVVDSGPRVGRRVLEAILCDAVVSVTARTGDGRLIEVDRGTRTLPKRLRDFVMARHGGRCAIDGCDSRYRIEIHHLDGWSSSQSHDPNRLMPGCWWHHQIAIHRMGMIVDETSPSTRRRLIQSESGGRAPP